MAKPNSQNFTNDATLDPRVVCLFGHAPRSHAEKRRAVAHLLRDRGLWRETDAQIARWCGVSPKFAVSMRKELERAQAEENALLALTHAWGCANDVVRMRFFASIDYERARRLAETAERARVVYLDELLDSALRVGAVVQSGAWFLFDDIRLGQGRANAEACLMANPEVADRIKRAVRAADLDEKVLNNAGPAEEDEA
jgi:hypothetical protein